MLQYWEGPEVSIPGADQKDRGLWGREWVLSVLCSNEECSASAQEMFTLATVSVPLHKLRIQASVCSSLQAPEGLAASPGQKGLRFHKNDQ